MAKAKVLRFTVCKGCKSEIDDMGCDVRCKYDVMNFAERKPETLEVWIYAFERVVPYSSILAHEQKLLKEKQKLIRKAAGKKSGKKSA